MGRYAFFALVLIGCVGDSTSGPDAGTDASTNDATTNDAGTADASDASSDAPSEAGPRCTPSKPFGNIRELDALNTAGAYNEGARLTPDEKTVYFTRYSALTGTTGDVYVSTRATTKDPFPVGVALNGGNTADNDRWPTVTADGLDLYVWRGPQPGVLVATRATTNDAFSTFALVSSVTIAGATSSEEPFVLPDHSALYFAANPNTGAGGFDLFRAPRLNNTTFDTPVAVPGINTAEDELLPALTPDELTIYFARGTGNPKYDIYVARRTSPTGTFGTPAPVAEINSAYSDFPSWISADDCEIVWTTSLAADGGSGGTYRILVADKPL